MRSSSQEHFHWAARNLALHASCGSTASLFPGDPPFGALSPGFWAAAISCRSGLGITFPVSIFCRTARSYEYRLLWHRLTKTKRRFSFLKVRFRRGWPGLLLAPGCHEWCSWWCVKRLCSILWFSSHGCKRVQIFTSQGFSKAQSTCEYNTVLWNHYVLLWNHHAVLWNHYVLLGNHHAVLWNHHVLLWNHHAVIWNHYVLLWNHHVVL